MDKKWKAASSSHALVPVSPNFYLDSPSRRPHDLRRPDYWQARDVEFSTKPFKKELVLRPLELARELPTEIAWEKFAHSLGFFEPIDKQKKCLLIFKTLVLESKKGKWVSSSALSKKLRISRGSVINHLRTLLARGLVAKKGRYYALRYPSLEETLSAMENDILANLGRLKKVSQALDDQLSAPAVVAPVVVSRSKKTP